MEPIYTVHLTQTDYDRFCGTYPAAADFVDDACARAEAEIARRQAQGGLGTPADQHHSVPTPPARPGAPIIHDHLAVQMGS